MDARHRVGELQPQAALADKVAAARRKLRRSIRNSPQKIVLLPDLTERSCPRPTCVRTFSFTISDFFHFRHSGCNGQPGQTFPSSRRYWSRPNGAITRAASWRGRRVEMMEAFLKVMLSSYHVVRRGHQGQ